MVFELLWSWGRSSPVRTALAVLGIVLACLPWGWRNLRTFDAVFFIRSNFGLELRMGNHDGAAAAMEVMDRRQEHRHPRINREEAREVQRLGEVAYMRQAGREARAWIAANPMEFVSLTAGRTALWWFGPLYDPPFAAIFVVLTALAAVGCWRALPKLSIPERAALVIPLVTYPVVYSLVAYMPRYREPVNWIFLLLAAAAFAPRRAAGTTQESDFSPVRERRDGQAITQLLFERRFEASDEPGPLSGVDGGLEPIREPENENRVVAVPVAL
jgi:hypothetical protein